jgi:hypothetical protein
VRKILQGLQLAFVPLGGGSSSIENQTSICCLGPEGLAQKIELVISWVEKSPRLCLAGLLRIRRFDSIASLETIRWGPRELALRRPVGY